MKEGTGLLIHGFTLNTLNWPLSWERVELGEPPNLLGRLSRGIEIVLAEDVEVLVFGTGSTERGGKTEAQYIRDYLLDNFERLKEFPNFQGVDLKRLKERIEHIARLETKSKNTAEEIFFTAEIFLEAGVDKIISVSSPDHIVRCAKEWQLFRKKHYPELTNNIWITGSDTLYTRAVVEDEEVAEMENLVIIEPPFYRSVGSRAQKVFQLHNNPEALKELDDVFAKYIQ